MSFREHCVLKKSVFPLLPCDEKKCSWYIHEGSCNNCFWILAHIMDKERVDFDIEEVARMEGITVEEVNAITEGAFEKLRRLMPQMTEEEEE